LKTRSFRSQNTDDAPATPGQSKAQKQINHTTAEL